MLIAICGLAGAGKTTSLDILEGIGAGAILYVGSFVTAEVASRGMPATPQSERLVRDEIREADGMAAFAQRALPTINGILEAGRTVLVDAIYCAEEYEFYRKNCDNQVVLIAVETAKCERERRLSVRTLRPIDSDALAKRDEYELTRLGLADVIEAAEYKIVNNGSFEDLERALERFAGCLRT